MKNVFIVFGWIVLVLIFAPMVDGYNHAEALMGSDYNTPFFLRAFGEARALVSTWTFLQADVYFHGGNTHHSGSHKCTAASLGKEEETPYINKFNILPRISEEITITKHIHLEGDQMKEIIPWLYYAAEIDPHNVGAYTLTAFYLADVFGQKEDALDFLREALKNNIDSWEINAEIGRVYFQHFKDYKKAIRYLSRADALQIKTPHDKFQERYVLTFLASSYEAMGLERSALEARERLHQLFPDEEVFESKLGHVVQESG